jgi:hypothetical protein
MAPSIDLNGRYWESPTYTPSPDAIQLLKQQLRTNYPSKGPGQRWITPGAQTIDSLDRDEDVDPAVLQLTLQDLQEIEDAATHFQGAHFMAPALLPYRAC